jgi:hypothetical protein
MPPVQKTLRATNKHETVESTPDVRRALLSIRVQRAVANDAGVQYRHDYIEPLLSKLASDHECGVGRPGWQEKGVEPALRWDWVQPEPIFNERRFHLESSMQYFQSAFKVDPATGV